MDSFVGSGDAGPASGRLVAPWPAGRV